jgi:hypothetical protein
MRARQASARTNDGAVSSLLANYSVGVKSQTLPFRSYDPRTYVRKISPASRRPLVSRPSPHGTLALWHPRLTALEEAPLNLLFSRPFRLRLPHDTLASRHPRLTALSRLTTSPHGRSSYIRTQKCRSKIPNTSLRSYDPRTNVRKVSE